jgi:hypothetical protein
MGQVNPDNTRVQPGSTVWDVPQGPNMNQINPNIARVQPGTTNWAPERGPDWNGSDSVATDALRNNTNNDEDLDMGKFGYKVRLFAVRRFPTEHVIFEVSPVLSEARNVEYAAVTPVHMPGSIQIYKRTNARTFSLTAKFISRNRAQATQNMKYLQLLRGWTMPYFGLRSATDDVTRSDGTIVGTETRIDPNSGMLGAPPDVLYLYAYSNSERASIDRSDPVQGYINIKKLPVVITSLSFDYPDDVDYIPVIGTGEPFPTKMDVRMELAETHSPKQYENFSLSMFKRGQLVHF